MHSTQITARWFAGAYVFFIDIWNCYGDESTRKIQGLTFTLQGIYDTYENNWLRDEVSTNRCCRINFSTTSQLGFKIVSILSLYVLAVLAALAIHFLVTYGVIIKYALKKNPVEFFKQISEVMITAFSTSSSNATLPTTIRNSIDNLKIDKDIANFVLTVGPPQQIKTALHFMKE